MNEGTLTSLLLSFSVSVYLLLYPPALSYYLRDDCAGRCARGFGSTGAFRLLRP
jgi:hypothetical protein